MTSVAEIKTFFAVAGVGGFYQMKFLSLNVSYFKYCAMLVKKVQSKFDRYRFCLRKHLYDAFQNLVGLFLFSNNKSF